MTQFSNEEGKSKTLFIHLTFVPFLKSSDEIKTKPTQHSVKELRSIGIQPDIVICRSQRSIPYEQRKKISLFCNVAIADVIETVDVKTIYEAPISFYNEKLDKQVLKYFRLKPKKKVNLSPWKKITNSVQYLSADDEDRANIAQSGLASNKDNLILDPKVRVRSKGDFPIVDSEDVQFSDIVPNQILSVAAAVSYTHLTLPTKAKV